MTASRVQFSAGLRGKIQVLEFMRAATRSSARSELVRSAAAAALREAKRDQLGDPAGQAQALLSWVQREIIYTPDVIDVETLQLPHVTLAQRIGDCDDQSMLLASMMRATGHRVRFGTSGGFGQLSHVFPEVLLGRRWVAADPTLPGARLGDRAPHDTYYASLEV